MVPPGSKGRAADVSPSGFSPSWSNSGEWLAFYRRDDTGLSAWISKPNGVDLTRITDAEVASPEYALSPYLKVASRELVWSPDDTVLAFPIIADEKKKLWLANVGGSPSGRLLNPDTSSGYAERDPVWMANGSIVYSSVDRSESGAFIHRIRGVDTNSGENKILFESEQPIRVLGADDSRQGLYFARRRELSHALPAPPATDIYRLTLTTGQANRVRSLSNAFFLNIHLTDDGKSLAYVSRVQDITTISLSSVNGDSTKDLLVINDPKVMISSLALSPNGDFIVYGKQTRTNLLSMLTK